MRELLMFLIKADNREFSYYSMNISLLQKKIKSMDSNGHIKFKFNNISHV